MSSPGEMLSRKEWSADYLNKAVSAILLEVGFDTAEINAFAKLAAVLEQCTCILQCCFNRNVMPLLMMIIEIMINVLKSGAPCRI